MKKILILLFIAASIFKTTGTFAQVNVKDSLALVALYDSTNGATWTNNTGWLQGPVKTWYGVGVAARRVDSINLSANNLKGTLPAALGNLKRLKVFNVSTNLLTGRIPKQLGSLKKLASLFLEHNKLSGNLPTSIGNLPAIINIDVSYNSIIGQIFDSSAKMTTLQYANASHNKIGGNLPNWFANCPNLYYIDLSFNKFTGSIPSGWGSLTNLIVLNLQNNQLSGTIPSSLDNFLSLSTLSLGTNAFTFNGMEGIASAYSFAQYSPQADIPLNYSGSSFSVSAGGTLANDTFRLYQNGVLNATQIGDSVFPVTSIGSYYMTITNAVATQLTLYTDTVIITSLPVKELKVSVVYSNKDALIKWTTASEINTAYFEVERSTDGINFTAIGKVNAAGNSTTQQNYNYTDAAVSSLSKTIVYYRIYEIDKDNAGTYSSIVMIKTIPSTVALSVFPNPATSVVNLNFSNTSGNASIAIFDMSGHKLQQLSQTVSTGAVISINTSNFAAGIYFVHVNLNGTDMEQKFVKQ